MNGVWHMAHVLGRNAPMDRRVEWHIEHTRECGCAPIPASVMAEIRARGIEVPEGPPSQK